MNCHVIAGAPAFAQICRLARALRADLIVLSTHGRTGLKHVFLGSTAERVVQHSPCPVLVDRKTPAKIETILVGVDFSSCSLVALKKAIAFADQMAAKIIVCHAVHLGYAFTADGYAMYDMSAAIKAARVDAEDEMRSFVRKTKFGGVKFETVVRTGSPVTEICRVAREKDAELIITATHGRTGFKHLLMGSVAEQIMRYAKRPVLIVPSHPDLRTKKLSATLRRTHQLPPMRCATKRTPPEPEPFTRRFRKTTMQPHPERGKTNRFRESHLAR